MRKGTSVNGTLTDLDGTHVYVVDTEGPVLDTDPQTVLDLLGAAQHADWIAVPAARLEPAMFDLATRMLGEWAQKFVDYRAGFAVIGDLSVYTEASTALTAFVYESNRGRHLRFSPDFDAFAASLPRRR